MPPCTLFYNIINYLVIVGLITGMLSMYNKLQSIKINKVDKNQYNLRLVIHLNCQIFETDDHKTLLKNVIFVMLN